MEKLFLFIDIRNKEKKELKILENKYIDSIDSY